MFGKHRKRIVGFTFKNSDGYYQSINESDHLTRASFLRERKDFKKDGVKIKDNYSKRPFVPFDKR